VNPSERFDTGINRTRFLQGVEQFNRGEYWNAHESWELVWLRADGERKVFLQGLIQLAASCYHIEKGNTRGATRLLEACTKRLGSLPETYGGIELEELRRAAKMLTPDDVDAIHELAIRVRPS